ncbi:MAG: DEAD/DEAH box helicase [Actinomycetota bacterium]
MPPTFAQLGVPDPICRALEARGITEPFEIQAATIADALDGRDVCGRAPTGSGKTLAFGIPLVATVERAQPKHPRGLVLAPTRELAEQIAGELRSFSGPVRVGVVYGGVGYGPQLSALRRGVDVLVACPGRLEDLIQQGEVHLDAVDRVVIDEADRMADMGFLPVVRRLLDQTARKRQTVLFSATLDGDVAQLTRDHQRDPVRHEVGEETPDVTAAHHVFWKVQRADRSAVTAQAVDAVWPAIVFCRTRHGSDRVAKQLGKAGIEAVAIHGGRSQNQRTRALELFASGRVHALVATDVAARGIHVDDVAAVVHYDPPEDHKTYLHRSGRTARAGRGGVVVSLVQPEQGKEVRKIQRDVGLTEPMTEPDAAALRAASSAPSRTLVTVPEEQPRRSKRSHNPSNDQRNPKRRKRQGTGGRRPDARGGAPKAGGAKRTGAASTGAKRSGSKGKGTRRGGAPQGPGRGRNAAPKGKRSGDQRRQGAPARSGGRGRSR